MIYTTYLQSWRGISVYITDPNKEGPARFLAAHKASLWFSHIFMAGVPVKVDLDAEGQAGSNTLVN